jgi:subtilisin family serine protease
VCHWSGQCPIEWITEAILWAADLALPRHIINFSMGFCRNSPLLEDAVNYALQRGVLIVASAGNAWSDTNYCPPSKASPDIGFLDVMYPARYPNVLAVGGLLDDDSPAPPGPRPPSAPPSTPGGSEPATCPGGICAPQSGVCNNLGTRRGPQIAVAAPFIVNTLPGPSIEPQPVCGTSMSAPLVTGVAALTWTRNPSWTATQVRQRIAQGAVALPASYQLGAGALDAVRAVHLPPVSASIRGAQFITIPGSYTWTAQTNAASAQITWSVSNVEGGPYATVGAGTSVALSVSPSSATRFWLRLTVSAPPYVVADEVYVYNETGNPCAPLVC